MGKKAKRYHPSFKFKAVLDSFIKDNVSEVARRYQINANQLSTWRKLFLDNGELVFKTGTDDRVAKLEKKIESLETLIGKKEVEINLLKKYLDFYAPLDGS